MKYWSDYAYLFDKPTTCGGSFKEAKFAVGMCPHCKEVHVRDGEGSIPPHEASSKTRLWASPIPTPKGFHVLGAPPLDRYFDPQFLSVVKNPPRRYPADL